MMVTIVAKGGREVIIRRPLEDDAANIIQYAKELFASTDQLLTTLMEYTITVDNEKVWIRKASHNPNALILVAEYDGTIIGLLDFAAKTKRKSAHTGEFGVSVHPAYQGLGIGKALVKTLVQWANENPQIEKVFLNVFHTNHRAINLYRSLGFSEEGRQVNAAKQPSGEYVDIIQMYCETK